VAMLSHSFMMGKPVMGIISILFKGCTSMYWMQA
jgi:hypothetical protein